MELRRALALVAEIQDRAAGADVYRGYRSAPVAASGILGILAAWLQPPRLAAEPSAFVLYWSAVAGCAAFVGVSEIVYNYVVHDHAVARRRTRRVIGQLLPSVLAAAIITGCFLQLNPALAMLLPGIWAICFGLGIFASRPFLVRGTEWIAVYFFAAGLALLWNARPLNGGSAWTVGGVFGLGQLLTAGVLYWSLESDPRVDETSWDDEHEEEES
jgi:hypothetical protein